jgi:hypothetical protein
VTSNQGGAHGPGTGVVNAYRYGNILCLVNDPSEIFPKYKQGDVQIYPAVINNFVFAMMATTQVIKAGKPWRAMTFCFGSLLMMRTPTLSVSIINSASPTLLLFACFHLTLLALFGTSAVWGTAALPA